METETQLKAKDIIAQYADKVVTSLSKNTGESMSASFIESFSKSIYEKYMTGAIRLEIVEGALKKYE
jgi:hypothetical protein